jgi:hypothetical protein
MQKFIAQIFSKIGIENLTLLTVLVPAGVFSRLIPHYPNVTALVGISIVSGQLAKNKFLKFFIPVIAMMFSDLIFGSHPTMFWVYGSLVAVAAYSAVAGKRGVVGIPLTAAVSSLLFFAVSNFGVWISGGLYPLTLEGLTQCFLLAVPFLTPQIMGDLAYTVFLMVFSEKVLNATASVEAVKA